VCRVSVGKREGMRPLGRRRRRWEDNIKMDLHEVAWGRRLDLCCSRQGQMAGCFECVNERQVSLNPGTFWGS
jgi:hypothetical protein